MVKSQESVTIDSMPLHLGSPAESPQTGSVLSLLCESKSLSSCN